MSYLWLSIHSISWISIYGYLSMGIYVVFILALERIDLSVFIWGESIEYRSFLRFFNLFNCNVYCYRHYRSGWFWCLLVWNRSFLRFSCFLMSLWGLLCWRGYWVILCFPEISAVYWNFVIVGAEIRSGEILWLVDENRCFLRKMVLVLCSIMLIMSSSVGGIVVLFQRTVVFCGFCVLSTVYV